jgi:tetratricopeptide (TPR) repeat protein
VVLLLVFEGGTRWLEAWGLVDTTSDGDVVQYVYDDLFERQGDWVRTTRYAEEGMVPSRFRAEKGSDRWRLMLVGGSFAMGSPFVHQNEETEAAGSITSWLRASAHARFPGHPAEIINLGVGGQDSNRVRDVALKALRQQPDVLVVATCNNEGFLPPGVVSRHLRQLGGYRLLVKLLRPEAASEDRPMHTLQHPDTEAIRTAHRDNLTAIGDAAAAQGVQVLFATLPVNILYEGVNRIHQIGHAPQHDDACVEAGRAHYTAGSFDEAVETLSACDDVPGALRWIGLSRAAQGRAEEARAALEQALELAPYNRCRPSMNDNIRAVAGHLPGDGAALVDLDARAIAESASGLPGADMFVDYCHMSREGYGVMADEIWRVLEREGWLPDWPADMASDAAWRQAVDSRGTQALEPVHKALTWHPKPRPPGRSPAPSHPR